MGIYWRHAKGGDNLRCFQCRGRASAPRHSQLPGASGKIRQRDCRRSRDGAAFGFETFEGAQGRGAGGCSKGGPSDVISSERDGHSAAVGVDNHVRTDVAPSVGEGQGKRGEKSWPTNLEVKIIYATEKGENHACRKTCSKTEYRGLDVEYCGRNSRARID